MHGVTTQLYDCAGVLISASVSGAGAPLLLLHGYPETKAMWDAVARELSRTYTVVAADLRGYGDSARPQGEVYSKREMAADQIALMSQLGFTRFAVAGHDRGGRVAHRMALDYRETVAAVAVLDIIPTLHMFENVDLAMSTSYFHWFFLSRPGGLPEALLNAAPEQWLESRFGGRNPGVEGFVPAAYPEYVRCFDSDSIRATCADYRAAATVDLEHDIQDRASGNVVDAPLLALWGSRSYVGQNFNVPETWQPYAPRVKGQALPAEHYLAEEAPADTADALLGFLEGSGVTW